MESKPMPMFAIGDYVRVKPLEELKRKFGHDNFIDTPCSFVSEMYEYCERELEVVDVYVRSNEEDYYYILDGGDGWSFDECVLDKVAEEPLPIRLSMNYEDLF